MQESAYTESIHNTTIRNRYVIEFDKRIKQYEKRCGIVDGKGAAVSIDEGTKIYREKGDQIKMRHWLRDVQKDFDGELIPFEWVSEYVGVTRAALHGRIKKGQLTMLVFEMQDVVKGILGSKRERMRGEYKYIPKLECDSWRSIIIEKNRT